MHGRFRALFFEVGHAFSTETNAAFLNGFEPIDSFDQRGFSGSRRTAHHHYVTFVKTSVQSLRTWKLPYHFETFSISIIDMWIPYLEIRVLEMQSREDLRGRKARDR